MLSPCAWLVLACVCVCLASNSSIVGRSCGTVTDRDSEAERIIGETMARYAASGTPRQQTTRLVPVQWHVVRESGASTTATDEQINDTMCILNDAFEGTPYVFSLLGITRQTNAAWSDCDDTAMYNSLSEDPNTVMNIYLCTRAITGGESVLGFANLPWSFSPGNKPNTDSVRAIIDSMPGGTAVPYNEGDTITHEVGHWLGLPHVFGASSCAGPDSDGVADTPIQTDPTYGFPTAGTTCAPSLPTLGGPNFQNFMDYSDDACMIRFTSGQFDRTYAAMDQYRPNVGNGYTETGCYCGGVIEGSGLPADSCDSNSDGAGSTVDGESSTVGDGAESDGFGEETSEDDQTGEEDNLWRKPEIIGSMAGGGLLLAIMFCCIVFLCGIALAVAVLVVAAALKAASSLKKNENDLDDFSEDIAIDLSPVPGTAGRPIPKPGPTIKTMKWAFEAQQHPEISVPVDARVEVVEVQGPWTKVRYEGKEGYVPSNYF